MTPYGDRDLGQHWFRLWLGAWLMLTFHHSSPMTFILEQFHKRCLDHQSLNLFENYMSKCHLWRGWKISWIFIHRIAYTSTSLQKILGRMGSICFQGGNLSSLFTCHRTCRCIWRNCWSGGMMCNTSRISPLTEWGTHQSVRLWSYWKTTGLYIEVLTNATSARHHKWRNMGVFHQRLFGMTTAAVFVEFFDIGWIEINAYLDR